MSKDPYANYLGLEADYYKVTNLSIEPCYMTWNKALLDDEDLELYEAFKRTPEYLGTTEEDVAARKRVPEAVKVRPFYERLKRGVQFKITDRVRMGKESISQPRYEYRFCIGANYEELEEKGSLGLLRFLCNKYEIMYSPQHTKEQLLELYREKFGPNVMVMNYRQWNESGLKARERRQLSVKVEPGETKATITNEGYLLATPITEAELEGELKPEKIDASKEIEDLKKEVKKREGILDKYKNMTYKQISTYTKVDLQDMLTDLEIEFNDTEDRYDLMRKARERLGI